MGISKEIEAKILRYYHVERWRVGTIARECGVHHTTVKRVLTGSGSAPASDVASSPLLEPFLPFVRDTLKKYPDLNASRLYDMVCGRGYRGGIDHFRHLIRMYRPKKHAEAYLRLRTLPGEQMQCDWGHFGHLEVGRAKRPLMAFVMVLSYSRKIFLHFYLHQHLSNFLRGHVAAFEAFKGIPKTILYDNCKVVVQERQGNAIRFNSVFLELCAHYRFEPRPVAVARGNEKGRVERSIRFIRDRFFAGREWKDLDDLNLQAKKWCEGIASDRPCPEDKKYTVRDIFNKEQPHLLDLPDNHFETDERCDVSVGKTPYVRFDLNDYSVPPEYVQQQVTVSATPKKVNIIYKQKIIATHLRSHSKGEQIETTEHIKTLETRKRHARQHRSQDYLIKTLDCGADFLMAAAERGYHLKTVTQGLRLLLEIYPCKDVNNVMQEALANNVPHPNAVRTLLEKAAEAAQKTPRTRVELPDDERIKNMSIRPHDLSNYDDLVNNQQLTNQEVSDEQ